MEARPRLPEPAPAVTTTQAGERVTAAVLAGGRSLRMGADKLAIPVQGSSLLERAIAAVAAVTADILVIASSGRPPPLAGQPSTGVHVVVDRFEGAGPLGGLEAALHEARSELVLVVAGDMPHLSPAVLRLLVARAAAEPLADVVALGTGRGLEPLVAVYRRRCLPVVRALLQRGELRLGSLLARLEVIAVDEAEWRKLDPAGLTPTNVNEMADLEPEGRQGG